MLPGEMLAVEVLDDNAELRNMAEKPNVGTKYSTGSSVYADQSLVNPNTQEISYW